MMGRILVFTGKGGVGKTSVAAAHARHSALEGKKTLIVSTDMAHNLSDIFEMPLGKTIKEVSNNLFALEIDPNHVMENDFQDMQRAIVNMIGSFGMPMGDREQLSVLPGMDELFSLLKIMEIHDSGAYERIIVDCAPTGETLSLLKFPELLSWYMEKLFPIGKFAMRVLAPISKSLFKVQLPDKAAVSDIEKMFVKLAQLQNLLKDRSVSSIRLVTMPEKMVVEETKRNYMYMNLYNFQVDGLYINRILPKDIDNPFFNEWVDLQSQYIEELEAVFGDMPIYRIPWFDTDLNGISGIDRIEQQVLRGRDVFKLQEDIKGERYEQSDDGYKLSIYLPCIEKGDLHLHESGTDIIIKIGNYKRSIPLPSSLRNHDVTSAKLVENTLQIQFSQ
ncbi:MAG TPA: ArsA family ATPase [Desulfosporosinus sp.]|nr:ArsA family ATPase [Desulfosporosinus sp.]